MSTKRLPQQIKPFVIDRSPAAKEALRARAYDLAGLIMAGSSDMNVDYSALLALVCTMGLQAEGMSMYHSPRLLMAAELAMRKEMEKIISESS